MLKSIATTVLLILLTVSLAKAQARKLSTPEQAFDHATKTGQLCSLPTSVDQQGTGGTQPVAASPLAVTLASDEFPAYGEEVRFDLIPRRNYDGPVEIFGRLYTPGPNGTYVDGGRIAFFNADTPLLGSIPSGLRALEPVRSFFVKKFSREEPAGEYIVETVVTDSFGTIIYQSFNYFYLLRSSRDGRNQLRLNEVQVLEVEGRTFALIKGRFPVNSALHFYVGRPSLGGSNNGDPVFSSDGLTLIIPIFGRGEAAVALDLVVYDDQLKVSASKSKGIVLEALQPK